MPEPPDNGGNLTVDDRIQASALAMTIAALLKPPMKAPLRRAVLSQLAGLLGEEA